MARLIQQARQRRIDGLVGFVITINPRDPKLLRVNETLHDVI